MRSAAALLASATSLDGLADVVRAAGLCENVTRLTDDEQAAIGIDDTLRVELGAGAGLVRVLLVRFNSSSALRDPIQRLARRLTSRAPHVLWLVGAIDDGGTQAA